MNEKKLLEESKAAYKSSKILVEPAIDRRKFNLELYTGVNPKSNVENADSLMAHVPYVKTLFDNVYPLLTAKLPTSKVSARNTATGFTAAKLMDRLLNYTFDVNQFEKKYMMMKKEAMLAGDSFAVIMWSPDPDKNYPVILHVNVDDVFPHPCKLDIDDEWPVFIRRELTKAQMIEMGWDRKSVRSLGKSKLGSKSYRKKQMEKLGLSTGAESTSSEEENEKDDLYEVIIRYGMMDFSESKDEGKDMRMGIVVIANEEAIINPKPVRDDLRPYESPQRNNVMPIAHLPYDPLPHCFFSQSFIDPVASDQVELNDLENMKRSNYYRRNNPPIGVDSEAGVDLSTLKFMTGLPWVAKGGAKAFEMMLLPDLAASISNDQKMIQQRMQNVTGASDYLNPSAEVMTKGGKSATQAAIMNENTKMRFRPQAVFEDRFMEKLGKTLVNLWQDPKFFNEEVALALTDDEGESEITLINNDMVQGELDFVTESASSIAQSDQAVMQTAVQIRELYSQDQTKDMSEVDKVILSKAGFDPNKIVRPRVGMIPELTSRLDRLTFLTKQTSFQSLPEFQKTKIYDQMSVISAQVKELTAKLQAQEQPPQQQGKTIPGQPQQGQQPAPPHPGTPGAVPQPGQPVMAANALQPKTG